jgi:DNA-binding transcriptional LysR family regulator
MTGSFNVLSATRTPALVLPARGVLDIDLLRTFVLIVRSGSLTAAGELVGRTQAAVSLQLKRLEDALGVQLLRRLHRAVEPTAEGVVLLGYAERILNLNGEAVKALRGGQHVEAVRLATTEYHAGRTLPPLIGEFLRTHPAAKLEQIILPLGTRFSGMDTEADVFLAEVLTPPQDAHKVAYERPLWFSGASAAQHLRRPTPVALPSQGELREFATAALNRDGLPWRLVQLSPSSTALERSAGEGIAVSPLLASQAASPDLLAVDGGLPELPVAHLIVWIADGAGDAAVALGRFLIERLARETRGRSCAA